MDAMHTAKEIERVLVLCLCDSINYALLNSNGVWNGNGEPSEDLYGNCFGQYWFQYFKEADKHLASKDQIAKGKDRVGDLDLQAFLKILRYRERLRFTVMGYYHPNADITKEFGYQSHFVQLLNTLINNYRNGIAAHEGADDIRAYSEQNPDGYSYKYQDAIVDMMRLAKYFPTTCNVNGQTYYSQLSAIYEEYKSKMVMQYYDMIKTIQAEGLGIDVGVFCKICYETGVDVYASNGMMYFATDNYAREVDRIRGRLSVMKTQVAVSEQQNVQNPVQYQPENQPKGNNSRKPLVIAGSIIGALLIAVIVLLILLLGRKEDSSNISAKNDQYNTDSIITEKDNTESIITEKANTESSAVIKDTEENTTEEIDTEKKTTETKTEKATEPVSTEEIEVVQTTNIKGVESYKGLKLIIDQVYKEGDPIVIQYVNGENSFALGWVETPTVTCKTDKGSFSSSINEYMGKIDPNESGELQPVYIDDLEGTIESITLSNVVLLNNGLPAYHNGGKSIKITITYETK